MNICNGCKYTQEKIQHLEIEIQRLEKDIWSQMHEEYSDCPAEILDHIRKVKLGLLENAHMTSIEECLKEWS